MDFFGLFGRQDRNHEDGADTLQPYRQLERKIDLILRELNISMASLGDADLLPPDVREMVQQGRKLEAIRRYREYANVDLKAAKDAVEGQGRSSAWLLLERKLDLILQDLGIEDEGGPVAPKESSDKDEVSAAIIEEIRHNRLINAIKLYREIYGVGLKESKDAVDALAERWRNR